MTQVLYALCFEFWQLITVLHVGKKQAAGSLESQDRDVNTILCPPCFFNVVPINCKAKGRFALVCSSNRPDAGDERLKQYCKVRQL